MDLGNNQGELSDPLWFGTHGQSIGYSQALVPCDFYHPGVPWLLGIFSLFAPLLILHLGKAQMVEEVFGPHYP